MSILSELKQALLPLGIPMGVGSFPGTAPDDVYIVILPIADNFALYADNQPLSEIQAARVSLFVKGNYLAPLRRITAALLATGFTVTERRFISFEEDTGYFHYAVEVEKQYETEEL